ncbi:MAG: methanol--corrinoid methyltransferase [Ignavibacteriales bacterium]|nr:methanol--corrinoid methyltransferase [Ignavibacteriales bacterium]
MRKRFTRLAFDADHLLFGVARTPLKRRNVIIGGGAVLPEIKFTLPPTNIEESAPGEIESVYAEIVTAVCERAVHLHQSSLVVEFELLPPMTLDPAMGEAITALLAGKLEEFRNSHGLQSLLRITPVDIREQYKPPLRRSGREMELLFESFRRCAAAGADLLSIESTGGKEVTDPSIMAADLRGILFGTAVLGCADMEYMWEAIVGIADESGTIAAGDTACGIGNTAMVLADQGYIPKVFAAVVRAITAVRSLVAYEIGAVGPGKDCGYENAILKAITGLPMSMEGKSAACAHLSPVGNIAGCYADLWSNESVQNVKLLSGMAPVISMEQLIYDCRLMNTSARNGESLRLRNWFAESDARLDPQAFILSPDVVVELGRVIVAESNDYQRGVAVGRKSVEILHQAFSQGELQLTDREQQWLERIGETASELPSDPNLFVDEEKVRWREHVKYAEYGMVDVPAETN